MICLSARVMEGSCPHAMGTIDENVDEKVDVSHAFPVLRAALRSCVATCDFETGKLTHPTSRFLDPNTVFRPFPETDVGSRLGW